MALVNRKSLRKDQQGTAIMEFSVIAGTLITMLFGIVEFANLFSQWNAAVKAVQVGARAAATSAPLWPDIVDLNGGEEDNDGNVPSPGESVEYDYRVVCTSSGCSGTESIKGNVSTNTYDPAAMNVLVYGRNPVINPVTSCNDGHGQYFGMCDIYKRITPANVRVTYEHTNAGYATRPGGLVPTVTVELINLNFEFILLDNVLGIFTNQDLDQIQIPGLLTTSIAEDMRPGAPNF